MNSNYAIWLVPSGGPGPGLYGTAIAGLAKAHSAPHFNPHVTLFSGLIGTPHELGAMCQKLAARIVPFRVEFTEPVFGETYYQCLYLLAAPSDELLQAHRLGREVFGHSVSARGQYMPHLSLMYTEPGGLGSREREGILGGLPEGINGSGFIVNSLWLYDVAGEPAGWRAIGEFRLGS